MNQAEALRAAAEAHDLWQQERLTGADAQYREAVAQADPRHSGEPDSARRVVAPSLVAAHRPLAWLVEAEALLMSGSTAEARAAAERAPSLAATSEQRERMRARLSELW